MDITTEEKFEDSNLVKHKTLLEIHLYKQKYTFSEIVSHIKTKLYTNDTRVEQMQTGVYVEFQDSCHHGLIIQEWSWNMLDVLTPFWLQDIQGNDWSKFDIRKCDCTYFDTFTISSGILWVKTEEIDFFYILIDVLLYRYMFMFFNVFLYWSSLYYCLSFQLIFLHGLGDTG